MSDRPTLLTWKYSLAVAIFGIVLGLVCFSQTIDAFFLADDFKHIAIVDNWGPLALAQPLQLGKKFNTFFRPFVSLSFYVNYLTAGLNPVFYHITNLLFYFASAVLVAVIAFYLAVDLELSKKQKQLTVYLSGLTFLLLPSHSESVCWISGRSDVIAVFFTLAAFAVYLFAVRSRLKGDAIAISCGLFFCGLLAKESVFVFPVLIFLHQVYRILVLGQTGDRAKTVRPYNVGKIDIKRAIVLPFLYGLTFFVYLAIRYLQLEVVVGVYGKDVHLNFDAGHILRNLRIYTARTFLPAIESLGESFWKAAIVVIVILWTIALWQCVRHRHKTVALAIIYLTIATYISFLPGLNLNVDTVSTDGERFVYFGSVFAAIALALVFISILKTPVKIIAIYACLLLFWGVSLYNSDRNWAVAGNISESVVASLEQFSDRDRVFIVNAPDNLNGAFVLRGGLTSAYELFYGQPERDRPPLDITVVRWFTLENASDTVEIVPLSDNSYRITLTNPSERFQFPPRQNPFFGITQTQPNEYELTFYQFGDRDVLVYYDHGRLVRYPDPPTY